MARVKVGASLLRAGIEAVVRLRGIGNKVFTVAGVVDGVRPRPSELGVETAQITQLPGDLQTVITRAGGGLKLVDDIDGRRKRRITRRWIMLIQIAEAEQLGARRAHVANLQGHGFAHRLLDVYVVILNVRRADFLIDRPHITGGLKTGKNWYARNDCARDSTGRIDCVRANTVVGRAGIEGVEWEVADEEILGERVIVKSPAG